jgi:hypothetical protein
MTLSYSRGDHESSNLKAYCVMLTRKSSHRLLDSPSIGNFLPDNTV